MKATAPLPPRFGALLGAILVLPCLGQAPRFEAGVTNVRIDALVTQKGRIVTGLEQRDFLIRDEGELRDTVAFANEALPLDVVLLCQFVHVPPAKYQQAFQYFSQLKMNSAAQALRGLRPEDRVAVISFGLDPQIEQPLTSDHAEIAAALRRIGTRSGPTVSGADHMAIEWALRLLAEERAKGEDSLRRSVILTVSWRGAGGPAIFNDEPAIFRLWEENTVLSAIIINTGPFPGGRSVRLRGDDEGGSVILLGGGRVFRWPLEPDAFRYRLDNLGHIAAETGGSVVYVPTDDFPDLLARVRSSYSLWFRPPEAKPGTVRRITVELTEKAKKLHPGAEIQARKGYVVR
jgi:VWFA-related protein